MPLIELQDVHKSFGERRVLAGVNLRIEEGESLVILGRSGIGKSVTLLIVTGLLAADAGRVMIDGRDVTTLPEKELIRLRRRFSYVFQSGALFDSLSIHENVAFPLEEDRLWSDEEIDRRVSAILDMLALRDMADLMPSEISTGARKRVAIARAIAADPRAILYDEPTTGVDPVIGQLISRTIRDLNRRLGVTSVVITHDLKCARIVADRVAFLDDGVVQFHDTFDAFLQDPAPSLARFREALPHMMRYVAGDLGGGTAAPEPTA